MNKQTKMLLGVAVVGIGGYLLWKQSQKPKSFANLSAGNMGLRTGYCVTQVATGQYTTPSTGVQPRCSSDADCLRNPPYNKCLGASTAVGF